MVKKKYPFSATPPNTYTTGTAAEKNEKLHRDKLHKDTQIVLLHQIVKFSREPTPVR